jgi:hypothetical protein
MCQRRQPWLLRQLLSGLRLPEMINEEFRRASLYLEGRNFPLSASFTWPRKPAETRKLGDRR